MFAINKHLCKSDKHIISYFSDEFNIENRYGNTNSFVYPYFSELLNEMIKSKSKHLKYILQRAINHNQKVYKKLQKYIFSSPP